MQIFNHKIIISMVSIGLITGCVAAVFEGGHIAVDEARRAEYQRDADRGDKIAQYKLGNSYCCSTEKSGVAYDTEVAVAWLCASARQGYAPAMYKLGKIYSGDLVDGLRLLRRATTGLNELATGNATSLPISYSWLRLADQHGEPDARARMEKVRKSMSSADIQRSDLLASKGLNIPCEMDQALQ